jgi:hypothetical protein
LRASHPAIAWLVADDPETARRHVREAMAQWSQSGFLVQHWQAMVAETEIELYVGNGARAYERIERDARALRKGLMLSVQFIRGVTAFLRGRCAIASLDSVPAMRRARLAEAQRMARQLEREGMGWTSALAATLSACVAHESGDRSSAVAALTAAIERAEAADMSAYAAAARYRLGSILCDEKGPELVARADEAMRSREVRAPARFAALLVPTGRPG